MACGILLLRIFRWFIGSRAISIKRTISLSFEDSQIKESIEPYYMARIVDVKAF